MEGPNPKVFISHSASGDPAALLFVQGLKEALPAWGINSWYDSDRLAPGRTWNTEIRRAIQGCHAAIIVMTDKYLRSGNHYARDEALIFAQRADTERFDDFRLLVLMAPGIEMTRVSTDPGWANLEIGRRQVIQLTTLDPVKIGQLKQTIDSLRAVYSSGSVPLVLREYYADQIGRDELGAVLAQSAAELSTRFSGPEVTPRGFVNVMLGTTPELQPGFGDVVRGLNPWRGVLSAEVREELGWDAIAFNWLDDSTAQQVATVTGASANRRMLVMTTLEENVVRLYLRRVRRYVNPLSDTAAQTTETTCDGIIRAICQELMARRSRRETRDPQKVDALQLHQLAKDLNKVAGMNPQNPLVVMLGNDLCDPDLLKDLPELFSNVILVAMVDVEKVGLFDTGSTIVEPQQEDEVLDFLDAVIAS